MATSDARPQPTPPEPRHQPTTMAYQVKTIGNNTKILLQDVNGPCPLIAAANVLLLRGVVSLSAECVRSGVASTDDVVNMLAGWAIERNSGDFSGTDHEYHLNEVLSLLPSLQHGMDVNPKFNGPTSVEYTNNLAVFDSLGIDLVHGWILDKTDSVAEIIGNKSYNELIEVVIGGNEAKEEVARMNDVLSKMEQKMTILHDQNKEKLLPNSSSDSHVKTDDAEATQTQLEKRDVSSDGNLERQKEPSTNEPESVNQENPEADCPSFSSEDIEDNNAMSDKIESKHDEQEQNTSLAEEEHIDPESSKTNSLDTESVQGQILVEITEIRKQISEKTQLISKSETINNFLTSSSHQLTYHGLEQLQAHLSENDLCVFFRNNHFATITKHTETLYLLITDLGYANTPDVVWEKLDAIDGDTEYTNEFFRPAAVRDELTHVGHSINPELLLAQRSQTESDHALALALSKGRATSKAIDEDERKLIVAATEASLKSYHHNNGTIAIERGSAEKSQIDADRELALAFHQEQEPIDYTSEQLAIKLQEMEYAQRQQPLAARPSKRVQSASSSRSKSDAASGTCVMS